MRENSFSFQSNNLTSNVITWITFTNNNREFTHNPTKIIHNIYYQILYFAHQIFIVNIVHHKYQEGLLMIQIIYNIYFQILYFPTKSMFTHKPNNIYFQILFSPQILCLLTPNQLFEHCSPQTKYVYSRHNIILIFKIFFSQQNSCLLTPINYFEYCSPQSKYVYSLLPLRVMITSATLRNLHVRSLSSTVSKEI